MTERQRPDATTVTREQLAALPKDDLRAYMPDLVNAFQASVAAGAPDYSRIDLRTEFYDRAYGLDLLTTAQSQAEARKGLWSAAETDAFNSYPPTRESGAPAPDGAP